MSRSPSASPPTKYQRAPARRVEDLPGRAGGDRAATATDDARASTRSSTDHTPTRRVRQRNDERRSAIAVSSAPRTKSAVEPGELQADHRAARAGVERRPRAAAPATRSTGAAAPCVQPPIHAVASAREHADGQRAGAARRQRRGDRAADDRRRAPLGIARRAERERLERDELERRADEQSGAGVADEARRRASRRRAGARSSPAES